MFKFAGRQSTNLSSHKPAFVSTLWIFCSSSVLGSDRDCPGSSRTTSLVRWSLCSSITFSIVDDADYGLLTLSRLAKFAGQLGFLSVFLLMTIIPSVQAHPDFEIVDGTIEIAPGKFAEFPLAVHYHRVVGTFEVINPADGTVNILLMDDQAFSNFAAGQPSSQLYSSGETNRGTIDLPIHCCIKARTGQSERDSDYTKYHLVIDNSESSSSTAVRLQVDLLHDEIAVVFLYGEPFAVLQLGGFLVLVPTAWSLIMAKRKRGAQSVANIGTGRNFMLLLGGSIAILFLTALTSYGFSGAIEETYGERAVAGITLPLGLAGGSLSLSVIMIPWVSAVYLRRKGLDTAVKVGSRMIGAIFLIQGIGSVLAWTLLALNSGFTLPPGLVFIFIVGVLQTLGGGYLIQRFRRKALMS